MSDVSLPEVWRDVVGFEGFYQVSDQGRVKSLPRVVSMIDGRTYKYAGKEQKISNKNYSSVCLNRDGKEITRSVHRLVLEAFVGSCPEGMECCHNDGNQQNNALLNLRWDTHSGNMKDKKRHGTTNLDLRGVSWKLMDEDVVEIRRLREIEQWSIPTIAKQFDVSQEAIGYRLMNRTKLLSGPKTTKDQAVEILKRLKNGEMVKTLAKEYGMLPISIKNIQSGVTWKHLDRSFLND